LTFELATCLVTFLVVTVIMVSAMQSYGNKL
jgi:Tfp pilus assembly protein PilX